MAVSSNRITLVSRTWKIEDCLLIFSNDPSTFDAGKASAYGSLCRLMSQKPEEKVPEGYYAAFYKCILKVKLDRALFLRMIAELLLGARIE
jgi:hypothetical protein